LYQDWLLILGIYWSVKLLQHYLYWKLEQAQKCTDSNHRNVVKIFLLKGIAIANDCDLKYKLSQNQRLLVELCLMQLASITFDGEKKS
jgi:hypothetical protein